MSCKLVFVAHKQRKKETAYRIVPAGTIQENKNL